MKGIISIALAIMIAGCSDRGFDLAPQIPEQQGYSILVRSESLTCTLGQAFPVTVDLNADGGYRWDCTITQPQVVTLDSSSIRPPDPHQIGGDALQTFYFRAVGAGSCRILMIQHRVWEPAVPPIEAIEYDITVRP